MSLMSVCDAGSGCSIMIIEIQNQIKLLYQAGIPDKFVDDSINVANELGLTPEIAAISALTEAYISGRFDVKYLTARGFEMLIKSIISKCKAAQKLQPGNVDLIMEYENAIADLYIGYEMKKDPMYLLRT